jgi:hypothetical protein
MKKEIRDLIRASREKSVEPIVPIPVGTAPVSTPVDLVKAGDIVRDIVPADLFDEVIDPKDVGYTHPVFLQCFLPVRHTDKNRERWQTDCGRMSLVIRAGELANPEKPNDFKKCIVPAGPKARFVVAYVNDQIQRRNNPTVNMGDSLREAMRTMNIAVGGKNGQLLQREVENFAASEITITGWYEREVVSEGGRVAPKMRFWLEKDPQQGTIWQSEMTVSREYFDGVREGDRLAPFYWPAMVALQHDTRAMDIHFFLTYRLKNGLKRPVVLHTKALHELFGIGIEQVDHFWPRFLESLSHARKWYPQARIDVKNDCIILQDSPPLIPYRKLFRIAGPSVDNSVNQ